jgi:hypothetical protein
VKSMKALRQSLCISIIQGSPKLDESKPKKMPLNMPNFALRTILSELRCNIQGEPFPHKIPHIKYRRLESI